MKKNIVIAILLFITLLSSIIAKIKADESIKVFETLEVVQLEAMANQKEAERQVEIASMRAAQIKAVQTEADKILAQLEACLSR